MLTITLHLDPGSLEDVAQAQRILDAFNDAPIGVPAHQPGPQVPSPQPSESPESVIADAVANLWSRIGPSLREFLKASAEQEGEFSVGDLATALGQPPNSIRSRFANLGRSINAMYDAVPAAPKPLYQEVLPKRNGIWYFTMPKAYREAILRMNVAQA
jgi:hypothetical protein